MRKFVVFFLILLSVSFMFVFMGHSQEQVEVDLYCLQDNRFEYLTKTGSVDFESFITEETYSFPDDFGTVKLHRIKNGDLMFFYSIKKGSMPKTFIAKIRLGGSMTASLWKHHYMHYSNYAADPIVSTYIKNSLTYTMQLPDSPCLIESGVGQRSVFVSRNGVFKELGLGLIKKFASPSNAQITLNEDAVELRFDFAKTVADYEEGWFVVSPKQLVDVNVKRNLEQLKVLDMHKVKMLRHDGWWLITREGDYKGWEENSYYQNPGFYNSMTLAKWYCQPENRLFYDIVIATLKMAVETTPECGYRLMPTESVVFKTIFNMGSDYLDTRFSTDCSRFMLQCARTFGSQLAMDKATKLAHAYEGFSLTSRNDFGRGFFLPDYIWSGDTKGRIHSSLNHVLCEMNYLFELYLATKDSRYLSLSSKFLEAIEDSCDLWIKPDGDLWYGYFPSENVFKRNDYPDLTLNDLKESCAYYDKIYGKPNKALRKLLDAKKSFLLSQRIQTRDND